MVQDEAWDSQRDGVCVEAPSYTPPATPSRRFSGGIGGRCVVDCSPPCIRLPERTAPRTGAPREPNRYCADRGRPAVTPYQTSECEDGWGCYISGVGHPLQAEISLRKQIANAQIAKNRLQDRSPAGTNRGTLPPTVEMHVPSSVCPECPGCWPLGVAGLPGSPIHAPRMQEEHFHVGPRTGASAASSEAPFEFLQHCGGRLSSRTRSTRLPSRLVAEQPPPP